MIRNGVAIDDTFAEAFDMKATRVVITALNRKWAEQAARTMTGFATSVIGCGIEAGIEQALESDQTPDGRPGVSVLIFAMSGDDLAKHLERRVGQCVLTAPTSAIYAGMDGKPVNLGRNLRYFGDGYQISKQIEGRRYWRVPVMDGEFLCEETTGRQDAIGGGNLLVLAADLDGALYACEQAVAAIGAAPNVIMPFPGGIVRSGSKVGSKYPAVPASTNDAYCPTLRGVAASRLGPDIGAVLEIVINGLTDADLRQAMATGIATVCELGERHGVKRISAGNYGGQLGRHHYHLRELVS
ncbi:MAG: formylmethanofuran--tetrahydromethanopterin N-formyltransferase [Gammaproteobacteria bacterium]